MKYNDLFNDLHDKLSHGSCDHTLKHAKEYSERHGLDFEELSDVLQEMGGYCDCEVLINAAGRIDGDEVIGKETFATPTQLATENGWYCHCRVDGVPASFEDAVTAKDTEVAVEWHVPCEKDAAHSSPDLNRAMRQLAG